MGKILVTRSSMPDFNEYIEEIRDLWDSHWLTNMGPKHKQFQENLKDYLDVGNIELLTNGHMALELTLQAMQLEGEVITTPFTFASTTHAIVRNGLKPVFCDIDPITFTIDVRKIETMITERTCAILPVHVYGNICNVDEIQRLADSHGLKVIYDAAHTFGEKYKGQGIGNYGDASCFSFHATKVFNSIEGGAVCFKDKRLGESIRDLRNFGMHGQEEVNSVGTNAKMNEFCAAMGICNLRYVDKEIEKRRMVFEVYQELLNGVEGLQLSESQPDVKPNYAYFPIVVHEDKFGVSRDEIIEHLKRKDIYARKYFYPLTNAFTCYSDKYSSDDTPVAKYISERVLTLPMYADLSIIDVEKICQEIMALKK